MTDAVIMPDEINLVVYRGDSFSQSFDFETSDGVPEILTGKTFVASFRENRRVITSIPFLVVTDDLIGRVTISCTREQAELFSDDGVWDLRELAGGERHTRIHGKVIATWDVTR